MSEWMEYKLGNISMIVDCEHKTAPLVVRSEYFSVRTSDISQGKIDFDKCNNVSYETYETWTKRLKPKAGDIILAREAPVGEVGLVTESKNVCLGQRTVLIRVNENFVISKYLLYYLINSSTKNDLISRSTGSVVEHLNVKDIKDFDISVHSIRVQEAIANILSSLDDKIDLLHRQNKTLEQLAETIFRQWFVEEADESWKEAKLGHVISVKGGTTPSTTKPEYWNGEYNWTSPRDLSKNDSVFLFSTEKKITKVGLEQIGSGLLPPGTVLLSSRAPIGYLVITEIPVAINQGYIAIICDKLVSNYFIYLWIKKNMDTIISAANGSVFLEISKSTFKELEILVPPMEVLKLFDIEVEPMFQKMKSNQRQIRTLTQLRDALLPKLISGEVRVNTI